MNMLKIGAIGAIVGGLLLGSLAWWIQGQRIAVIKMELKVAVEANQTNQATIKTQKEEIEKINKSCSARIDSKDKTIKKIRDIDNLKPEVKKDEKNTTVIGSSGNSILDTLNSMYRKQ